MDHSKSQAAFTEAKQDSLKRPRASFPAASTAPFVPSAVLAVFRLSLPKAAAANSPTSTATNISIMYFLTVLYF